MNITIISEVRSAFTAALRAAFPSLPELQPLVTVSNPSFGDYQCNSAMSMFKKNKSDIGNVKSPFEVATLLKDKLPLSIFSDVSVANQGYITVRVSPDALKSLLVKEMEGELEKAHVRSLSCLVDYSSPNIAKEMHVGHLRSTILGESICRLLEFAGHKVLRVNHVGDWGTQFGMLIEYMKEVYPDFQVQQPNLSDLTSFYREAKIRFDSDTAFKDRSRLAVTALQSGDPAARDAWKFLCEISFKDFQQIYDRFGINLVLRGESYYNDLIPGVVEELDRSGHLQTSDGAKVMFVEDDKTPLMVVKSDGGYGYDTTDLAAIKHRLVLEKHDWVIYVTDIGQESHFMKLFKAARAMGWYKQPDARVDHVGFGLIQGQDGKKFKTRSGDSVKLTDLLDEAVERASKELEKRREEAEKPMDGGNEGEASPASSPASSPRSPAASPRSPTAASIPIEAAASAIGYSAVRYFDLKQNRLTNYKFSYDKMLDPKGNTAVYMLYAYARICSIFRKAGVDPSTLCIENLKLEEEEERHLALQTLKFYEVVNCCLEDLHLHRIAEYIYDLSAAFTQFYQRCKVIGSPQQESRLLLCELTRRFLGKSFYLMGITPLSKL